MATKEEMEIEISPSGEVKVHIKGLKGKGCLKYETIIEDIVGEIKQKILTTEYYEPEPKAKIHIEEKDKS